MYVYKYLIPLIRKMKKLETIDIRLMNADNEDISWFDSNTEMLLALTEFKNLRHLTLHLSG